MKYLRKVLLVSHIDLLVYSSLNIDFERTPININFEDLIREINREKFKNKELFELKNLDNKTVHRSSVYFKTNVLKVIHKKGVPVIGDCFTIQDYRGLSIYPYMLQYIDKTLKKEKYPEVLIMVSPNNVASIKGIEKANFKKICHIEAKRWAIFYFSKKIIFYN